MDNLKCLKCETGNKPTARFCVKCGTSLFEKCPGCEQENDYTVSFCPNCGYHLNEWRQKRTREKEFHPIFEEGQVRFYQNEFDQALESWTKIPTDLFNLTEKIAEAKKKKELYLASVKKGNRAFNKKLFAEAVEQYNITLQLAAPAEKNKVKEWLTDAATQSAHHLLEEQLTLAQKLNREGRFKSALGGLEKLQPAYPDDHRIQELLESVRLQSSRQQIDRLISSGNEFFEKGQYHHALINWEKAARNVDDATRSLDLIQKISAAQKRLKSKKLTYLGISVGGAAILLILIIPVIFTRFASPEKLYQKASKLESANRLDEARIIYEKLIELAPDHVLANEAHKRINQVLITKEQPKQAVPEPAKNEPVTALAEQAPIKSEPVPPPDVHRGTGQAPMLSGQATESITREELTAVQVQAVNFLAEKKFDSAMKLYQDFIDQYGLSAEELKIIALLERDKIKENVWGDFKKRRSEIKELLENASYSGLQNNYEKSLTIWEETTRWETDFLSDSRKELGVKILEQAQNFYRDYYEMWVGRNSAKTLVALRKLLDYTWDPTQIQLVNQEIYSSETQNEEIVSPDDPKIISGHPVESSVIPPDKTTPTNLKCPDCESGRLKCRQCENKDELKFGCSVCQGLGFIFCNRCKGDGIYTERETGLKQAVEKFLQ
ncbi:MAG: zinc ribbon domain-containing protein [Planctomycetota bacterium]